MIGSFFAKIYRFFQKQKVLFYCLLLAALSCFFYSALKVSFQQDVSSMLPTSNAIKAINKVIYQSKAGDKILFFVSLKDTGEVNPDLLINKAEDLSTQLNSSLKSYIRPFSISTGAQVEEELVALINTRLPLLLLEEDYLAIEHMLSPEALEKNLEENKKLLLSPASVVYKKMVAADPVGMSNFVWKRLSQLKMDPGYETIDGYIFADQQKILVFNLDTKNAASALSENSKFIELLNEKLNAWKISNPEIEVEYFGAPAVAVANSQQMQKDTILTLSITIVLLLIVTIYYFRGWRSPILLLVPVAFGGLFGLSVVYWVQGSLSLLAVGAGSIILGIAIDFSIHYLSHQRLLKHPEKTVRELAQPLIIGSLTTILAFLSLRLASTPVLRDFGLFASASLTGSVLATLMVLPQIISSKSASHRVLKPNFFDRIAKINIEKNKALLLVILLSTPILIYYSQQVKFDDNLLNLNYMSPQLEKMQQKIMELNKGAVGRVFVLADGKSEDQALNRLEELNDTLSELEANGVVTSINSPIDFLTGKEGQKERIERWNNFWQPERVSMLEKNLRQACMNTGFNYSAFLPFIEQIKTQPDFYTHQETELLKSLYPMGFSEHNQDFYAIASLKVSEENRAEVLHLFDGKNDIEITDKRQGAEQLVGLLHADFLNIALYTSFIVFFALLIAYGRIEIAIISFAPMAISWVFILGLMAVLGIQFNIVNIIISTLIFGLGDDYSIFTMDALVEKYRSGTEKLTGTRSAVYLSAATTVIGLGVLIFAKHPALKSIAWVSVTGILCVVVVTQILQPFLFNWFIADRAEKRHMPFSLRSFFISVFAFTYFFLGCLVLLIVGFLFTIIWPFNKEKGKYCLHVVLSKLTWSMMYIMGNVKKKVLYVGTEKQDLNTPAIYFANHSSFLDILLSTMLMPKVVLLTNKWVWKSPFFGKVVQMAEYYPVANGAGDSIAPLEDLVKRGYSIIIFPEGTRSYSDKIERFKKGAAYLAERLRLDMVPMLFHGVHYTMQKGDWFLKDGTTSMILYDRIHPEDESYGVGFVQRTKGLNRWMRQELNEWKIKNETPAYFKQQLFHSYLYKGPVLEWYCKIKTRLEKYYEPFHELIPRKGKFYDLGCGYGFMTYMLHWSAEERTFVGLDYDEKKIETARNIYMKSDKVQFRHADLTEVILEPCDGIFINDVLHYLESEEQEKLINKCAAVLSENGVLIVRDGVKELEERLKGTKLTELFSTQLFNFNKTKNDLNYISQVWIEKWASENGFTIEVIDNAKFTSNLIFVLKKKSRTELNHQIS